LKKKEEMKRKRKIGCFSKRKREIKGGQDFSTCALLYFISPSPGGRWRRQRADSENEGWKWGIKLSDN